MRNIIPGRIGSDYLAEVLDKVLDSLLGLVEND